MFDGSRISYEANVAFVTNTSTGQPPARQGRPSSGPSSELVQIRLFGTPG